MSDGTDTLSVQWLAQGDADHDGTVSRAEMRALAATWFNGLSGGGQSEVTPDTLQRSYRRVLDPTPTGGGVMAAMQGSSPLATGLFLVADADKDGVLTQAEFERAMARWYEAWGGTDAQGLSAAQLQAGLKKSIPQGSGGMFGGGPPPTAMVQQATAPPDFSDKPPVMPASVLAEQKSFRLPKGYHLEPVLADPDIEDPMAIAFDGDGRLYVVEERTYMRNVDGKGTLLPLARVSVHEDRNGDGVYETHHVLFDKVVFPRFILPLDKGQWLMMESNSKDVYKYTDTDGDGVPDRKELYAPEMNRPESNVEHQSSSLFWALDNHLYISASSTRLAWSPKGVTKESIGANMGQWGIAQDDDGRMFFQGGEIGVPVQFQAVPQYGQFSMDDAYEKGYTEPWGLGMPADFQGGMSYVREDGSLKRVTGAAGAQVYRGDRLPKELYGDYFSGEPVARIVRRTKVVDLQGTTQVRNAYQAEKSEFIRSSDPLFRPLDMQTAPDGTLYICDAYRGIIQESQWTPEGSYLRKKILQYQLDKNVAHGRIWRLVHDGQARDKARPRMLQQPARELVKYLAHPNGWWRDQAQKLLVLRQDKSVVPALKALLAGASVNGRIHALWTLDGLGAATHDVVARALADKHARVRAQAIRVSESLYKAGDHSLVPAVTALARGDADYKVVIQALLTLNYLRAPGTEDLVRSVSAASPWKGVREFGSQILNPRAMTLMVGAGSFSSWPEAERAVLERGQEIYAGNCVTCHGADGVGTPVPDTTQRMGASLANSAYVQGDPAYAINALLHGLSGSKGDGKAYLGTMVGLGANNKDQWLADVLSYVRNSFGNAASFVTADEVAAVRAQGKSRTEPWPIPDLLSSVRRTFAYDPDWKLTASAGADQAGFAINSSGNVSWSAGQPQAAGQWYAVEFTQPVRIAGVELVAPLSGGGYPRAFDILASDDGRQWTTLAANRKASGSRVRVDLEPVGTRFLRIELRDPGGQAPAWSIQKLRFLAAPARP